MCDEDKQFLNNPDESLLRNIMMREKKSWNTKKYRDACAARIAGKTCIQCGSSEVLQVHHTLVKWKLYQKEEKEMAKLLIKEKMDKGEIEPQYKNFIKIKCPDCGAQYRAYFRSQSMPKTSTCRSCHTKLTLSESITTIEKELNYYIEKDGYIAFKEKYREEIKTRLKKKGVPDPPEYTDLSQDTIILCRKCHYAWHHGKTLCPICKKTYKRVHLPRCFYCLPPEEQERIKIAKKQREQEKKAYQELFEEDMRIDAEIEEEWRQKKINC